MAKTSSKGPLVAAVDLGSNSFHLVLARVTRGRVAVVERMKEMVGLGAGLDASGALSSASQRQAVECLERFGRCTQKLPAHHVRAVGTNALRAARDAGSFLERAERALGHPVEIISGVEEARLTYAGVASDLPQVSERRLVVDIGGGSTEVVLGVGEDAIALESLPVGSGALTRRRFGDGSIDADRFREAELDALRELEPTLGRFRRLGWDVAIGASGTVRAAARATGSGAAPATLRRQDLAQLRAACVAAGQIGALSLPGMTPARAASFPGGLAVLCAVLDGLKLDALHVSATALREGLLGELRGRVTAEARRSAELESR